MTGLPAGHEVDSEVGLTKEELTTPALLLDLDILERNVLTMSDYYNKKQGASLRPHQKGHRLPAIARLQMGAGAKGVSMTSFALSEYYVSQGIQDILLTTEICGRSKIQRLCELSNVGDVTVGVDSLENARELSKAAERRGAKINVAVELYMGQGSCGVRIEEAARLVKELLGFPGLHFKGIWWHEGSVGAIVDWEERKRVEFRLLDRVADLKAELQRGGVEIEMLSGGQTSTWNITPEYPNLSEVGVQAGNYVFSDWVDRLLEGQEVFDCALTVLTTCISRPGPGEAMFDSGMNSCSDEAGGMVQGGYSNVVGPKFKDLDGVDRTMQREEIMLASFRNPGRTVRVGDVFELIPPHADTTAKLHDRYYGMRKGKVEVVWPNHGRGLF
jgi:3-hydroxy-D-aspartate aldolase